MTYTVGDLVAEFLAAAGVTTAFGIVSVHNRQKQPTLALQAFVEQARADRSRHRQGATG